MPKSFKLFFAGVTPIASSGAVLDVSHRVSFQARARLFFGGTQMRRSIFAAMAVLLNMGNPSLGFEFKNVHITADHSGQCLDVAGASQKVDAQIIQFPCFNDDMHNNQRWTIHNEGGGFHSIKALHSGMCMHVNGVKNSATVIQKPCRNVKGQRFAIDSGDNTKIKAQSALSKCLDIEGGSFNAGAFLIQFSCLFQGNQRFHFNQ